jgi:hypothetical protein
MIEIHYTAPLDLEISGTVAELQAMRRTILNLIQSDLDRVSFAADASVEPSPYDSALAKLVVVKGQCPTKVSVKNEKEVHVEGALHCLEAFASFIDFKSDAGRGTHSHFEYYEGEGGIAADSIPLVIRVK